MIRNPKLLTIVFAAIPFSIANIPSAHSASGDRVGNGGVGITENNALVLRDLSQQSCSWQSGKRLTLALPEYERILATLSSVEPLYGSLMREAASAVNICLVENNLIQVTVEDKDGVTIFNRNDTQLAIRVGDEVYIDAQRFAQLDDVNKAYLTFHEILHSFVGPTTSRRNAKMRGFVKFVFDMAAQPITPEMKNEFQFQIKSNEILWPTSLKEIEQMKRIYDQYARLLSATASGQRDDQAFGQLAFYVNIPDKSNYKGNAPLLIMKTYQYALASRLIPNIDAALNRYAENVLQVRAGSEGIVKTLTESPMATYRAFGGTINVYWSFDGTHGFDEDGDYRLNTNAFTFLWTHPEIITAWRFRKKGFVSNYLCDYLGQCY